MTAPVSKTSEVVLRTDGSHETDLYNASGELTQTIFKAAMATAPRQTIPVVISPPVHRQRRWRD